VAETARRPHVTPLKFPAPRCRPRLPPRPLPAQLPLHDALVVAALQLIGNSVGGGVPLQPLALQVAGSAAKRGRLTPPVLPVGAAAAAGGYPAADTPQPRGFYAAALRALLPAQAVAEHAAAASGQRRGEQEDEDLVVRAGRAVAAAVVTVPVHAAHTSARRRCAFFTAGPPHVRVRCSPPIRHSVLSAPPPLRTAWRPSTGGCARSLTRLPRASW
jgi:hypothetical protein